MSEAQATNGALMAAVSNAMVALHKEQFGRGPTAARSNFAGADTLVCILDNALLPAEWAMVEMGEQTRPRHPGPSTRSATADRFIGAVEQLTSRKVRAFASAIDPDNRVAMEVFVCPSARRQATPAGAS